MVDMNRKWSDKEIEIVREYYRNTPALELTKLLNNKTEKQIRNLVKRLGIKKEVIHIEVGDLYKCNVCDEELIFNEDNFYSFKGKIETTHCKRCRNRIANINSYKRKYGITMDIKKYYDTYDIIQWYRWTLLDKTPNEKFLTQIPTDLINKKNINKITKYVVEELLGFKTREDKLNFKQNHLNKFKIGFSKIPFVLNSPQNLLRIAYPELNFKDWEFSHATNNFWKSYDNFLDAVKTYYYDVLSIEERNDIDIAFSEDYISYKFGKLGRARDMYYYRKSWNTILSDAQIKAQLKDDKCVSYDGNKLNSHEEVLVYNYIHNVLGIRTLKFVGSKRKGKYIFHLPESSVDKRYIPDFVIERFPSGENFKKINKPVIVEYFGLYCEDCSSKPLGSRKMFESYKEKTKRKVEFYSQNKDIVFIALYKDDILHGFKGVEEKINCLKEVRMSAENDAF